MNKPDPREASASNNRFPLLLIPLSILLMLAVAGCGPSVDEELEQLQTEAAASGSSVIYQAAANGRLDLVQEWMKREGEPYSTFDRPSGNYAIHAAVRKGDPELVAFLLEHLSRAETTNDNEERPIHVAVNAGKPGMVRFLVERKVQLDQPDVWGNLPVHLAAESGSVEILKILEKGGAALDARAALNRRKIAGISGMDSQTLSLYRNGGIDPVDGQQPIHVAAQRGHVEVVRYLLQKGISPGSKDNNGLTPGDYAAKEGAPLPGRQAVIKLLAEALKSEGR